MNILTLNFQHDKASLEAVFKTIDEQMGKINIYCLATRCMWWKIPDRYVEILSYETARQHYVTNKDKKGYCGLIK